MKLLLLLTLTLFVSSCTTKRACMRKFPPKIETVTNTVTIIRDSIITFTLPGDTVTKTDTVWMDAQGLINSRIIENDTEYCYSFARVLNGVLLTELRQKESEIKKLVEGAVKIVTVEKEVTRLVEVNRVKWWQSLLMWIGAVSVGVIGVWVGLGRR
jgi:hypothetical protein